MIMCPYCLHKINKEVHEVAEKVSKFEIKVFKCPSCRQEITNLTAIPTTPFPNCVTKVRYVGLNSEEDARKLLEMMK